VKRYKPALLERVSDEPAALDLTPIIPAGRQVIERYAPSGFRVSGVIHYGPILVFPNRTVAWDVANAAEVTSESLAPVIEHGGVQILLLGLGLSIGAVPRSLRANLRAARISLEPMETGAACRTFNVLVAEDRHVAAALIPPAEHPVSA
jgi:uncharacterized protein